MPICRLALIGLTMLAILGGCSVEQMPERRSPVLERGHLLFVPGIDGGGMYDRVFTDALQRGGLDAEVEVFNWCVGRNPLQALQQDANNRDEARRLAGRIAHLRFADPQAPIWLVCISGGAGIGVWALEELPADIKVDGVALLAPALSPEYDLSEALAHVDGHLDAFSSRADWLILGAGTRLFGTMDGEYTASAGLIGFDVPPQADDAQYAKLRRRSYDSQWLLRYGYFGDHFSIANPRFARKYLSPMLASSHAEDAIEQ